MGGAETNSPLECCSRGLLWLRILSRNASSMWLSLRQVLGKRVSVCLRKRQENLPHAPAGRVLLAVPRYRSTSCPFAHTHRSSEVGYHQVHQVGHPWRGPNVGLWVHRQWVAFSCRVPLAYYAGEEPERLKRLPRKVNPPEWRTDLFFAGLRESFCLLPGEQPAGPGLRPSQTFRALSENSVSRFQSGLCAVFAHLTTCCLKKIKQCQEIVSTAALEHQQTVGRETSVVSIFERDPRGLLPAFFSPAGFFRSPDSARRVQDSAVEIGRRSVNEWKSRKFLKQLIELAA